MRTTRPRRWLALTAAATVLVTGCSAEDTSDASSPSVGTADQPTDDGNFEGQDEMAAEEPAADGEDAGGETSSLDDGIVTFGGSGSAVTGRQLARTASVIIEVADVEQGASRVAAAPPNIVI